MIGGISKKGWAPLQNTFIFGSMYSKKNDPNSLSLPYLVSFVGSMGSLETIFTWICHAVGEKEL